MSSPPVSALLIEAPVNRHFAQLHRDPQALTDAVTLYLETGLRRCNPVVVIASRKHTDLFLRRSEEHTSELQSRLHLVCRLLLEKKKKINTSNSTSETHT